MRMVLRVVNPHISEQAERISERWNERQSSNENGAGRRKSPETVHRVK